VSEIVGALGGREGRQQVADGVPQGIDGAGGGFAQQRLELGEDLFDEIEVGAVRRPITQDGAGGFNGCPHTGDEAGGVPVAMRGMTEQAVTLNRASVTRRHIGRDPGLVDGHQPGGLQVRLRGLPGAPRRLHLAALLFGGDQRFFIGEARCAQKAIQRRAADLDSLRR
jgi:hypothetical protein